MKPIQPNLVSTIIPVRNRPALLVEAVESVLAQIYRPIEIIIVDDGSTDGTPAVGRTLASARPIEIQFLPRNAEGVAAARNAGLDRAAGEFIQFLDSDDVLMPAKFTQQVAGLRARPECGISYCRTREYKLGGEWSGLPARRTGESLPYLFPHLLMGRVWAAPSPLYRRSVIDDSGPMASLAIYEDWEYEGRAAARNVGLHYCDAYLADKRDSHHLVGGQKGGTRPHKLKDYAEVHRRLYQYALAANVGRRDLDRFAGKLFSAARSCAAGGAEDESRMLIELAQAVSRRLSRSAGLAIYSAASHQLGWRPVAQQFTNIERSKPFTAARSLARWPRDAYRRWHHRFVEARATTTGQPLAEWPHLLASRWAGRQSRPR